MLQGESQKTQVEWVPVSKQDTTIFDNSLAMTSAVHELQSSKAAYGFMQNDTWQILQVQAVKASSQASMDESPS